MTAAAKFRIVRGGAAPEFRECLKCRFRWLVIASGPDCPLCEAIERKARERGRVDGWLCRPARLDSPSESGRDTIGAGG